jgi:hypothetical protein
MSQTCSVLLSCCGLEYRLAALSSTGRIAAREHVCSKPSQARRKLERARWTGNLPDGLDELTRSVRFPVQGVSQFRAPRWHDHIRSPSSSYNWQARNGIAEQCSQAAAIEFARHMKVGHQNRVALRRRLESSHGLRPVRRLDDLIACVPQALCHDLEDQWFVFDEQDTHG